MKEHEQRRTRGQAGRTVEGRRDSIGIQFAAVPPRQRRGPGSDGRQTDLPPKPVNVAVGRRLGPGDKATAEPLKRVNTSTVYVGGCSAHEICRCVQQWLRNPKYAPSRSEQDAVSKPHVYSVANRTGFGEVRERV